MSAGSELGQTSVHQQSSQARLSVGRRDTWLAVLLFTALTALLAYPISVHPYSLRFPTGPDGDLGWYLLGWNTHAFVHKPWAIFDANIYYPNRLTLAYGENVIGISFFAAPIIWLSGDLLLAANFVCLLSTVLCGLGAYVLARRVGLSMAAALICGVIFLASPPRFFRIGQMNLTNIQWIPFGLAALHAYFDTGRKRDLRLAATCTTLQALSSGHGAVFMGVALLVFFIYRFALGEPLRLLKRIRDLGIGGALILLPTFLVFLPYRAVQTEVGLKRGLGTWVTNYGDFIASPSHLHRFLLSLTTIDGNTPASAFLFPGYLAVVLAGIAIASRIRNSAVETAESPRVWPRAALALELTLVAAATMAGLLTVGTLIVFRAGTQRLIEPAIVVRAWLAVGGLAALGAALARWLPSATVARHRRPLRLLLTAALLWTLIGLVRPALRAGDGLTAHYFANATWDGWPAGTFVDTQISTARIRERWNGLPPERFSARWLGYLAIGRAGRYRFATTSDDGSRLYIDDQLVVDNGGAHSAQTRSGEIELTRGAHRVRLDYVQFGGDTALRWTWARATGRDRPVPAWVLSRRPAGYGVALASRFVDFILFSCTLLLLLATTAYVRTGLAGDSVRAVTDRITAGFTNAYRDRAAFAFSVAMFVAMLCVPWPGGSGHWSFFRSVVTTIRDVNRTAVDMLRDFASFQARLNTPGSGEEVLPVSVREMVSMLDAHKVQRYMISGGVAANAWVYQQIIASAWPRTLEHDAKAKFMLNTESVMPGCALVESRTEVSLVHCP